MSVSEIESANMILSQLTSNQKDLAWHQEIAVRNGMGATMAAGRGLISATHTDQLMRWQCRRSGLESAGGQLAATQPSPRNLGAAGGSSSGNVELNDLQIDRDFVVN